jgi:hypothetical protein
MNNREIVDYILSNKLTKDDVIKRIYKDEMYIYIQYLYNDGFVLWDENGNVNIFSFCDDDKECYTYEVISQEQAQEEIEEKLRKEKIERLERELRKLKESGE